MRDARIDQGKGVDEMKVLAICGSPRNGNTKAMLERIIEGIEGEGHGGELVLLKDLNIEHCTGCESCRETSECIIRDGMDSLYPKLRDSDVIILGSPSYWDNVSGLLKDFMDRTDPLWQKRELKGKRAVLVGTGSVSAGKAIDVMHVFCNLQEMKVRRTIFTRADGPEEAGKDGDLMKRYFELGKEIAGWE